ncbi:MAG: hypothetical protein AAFY83_04545 [Pseudomonadota bacterium]
MPFDHPSIQKSLSQRERWHSWQMLAGTGSIAQSIFEPRIVSRFDQRLDIESLAQIETLVKTADFSVFRGFTDDFAIVPTCRLSSLMGTRNG